MEFRILGPVEVWGDEGPITLGGPQQRRLAAALLTERGHSISAGRLVEVMWPDGEPPEGARRAVMTYVSRLRTALGDGVVVTRDEGYALQIKGATLDADRFEQLVSEARTSTPPRAVQLLAQALALWRGPAFGELRREWWAQPIAARLDEARLVAEEELVEARLALGAHGDAIAHLEGLVRAHPTRERFVRQLALALYRADRQADALRELHRFRARLVDSSGLDASLDFDELEHRIIEGDATLSQPAGRTLRSYVLSEVIGQGAYGTVYRATQPFVGREVAIKVLRAEHADAPEFVRRFESEAQLMARLEDPRVVPLYDFWREPGSACLVMRLMRGGSAEQVLAEHGRLPLDRVTGLVERIGGAVHAAHAAGLVHGDVKPANVLFDEGGDAYLGDFGIALTDGGSALSGPSTASPVHASPETLQARAVSARSDQYSLAATAWELLTGLVPYAALNPAELLRDKLARPLPSIRPLRPELPGALDLVLQRATAPDPAQRFENVAAFTTAWRDAVSARPSSGEAHVLAPNPYVGLRAFREADAAHFFGREQLTEELFERINAERFFAVVGASGSGKSSAVLAGLVPRLRHRPGRFVATMSPGSDPLSELETALASVAVGERAAIHEGLKGGDGLRELAATVLPRGATELVLVVDQLEELWTLTDDPAWREHFLRLLARAVSANDTVVRVVATLRADLFDRPLEDPTIGGLVAAGSFPVTPMTAAEVERAITEPARAVGVTIESALIAELVAGVAAEPGSLPLLQFVLAELYERRDGATMTSASSSELGGLGGALARRADALVDALTPDDRDTARRLFTRLVQLGEGTEDTARRVTQRELAAVPGALVDVFAQHRLLVLDREAATRERTVELAHEALIRRWPRLRRWLDADREGLRLLRHVTSASDAWEQRARDPNELYRGARLEAALDWAEGNPGTLAPTEAAFLSAGVAARDAETERRHRATRRLQRLTRTLAVILVVAIAAAALALVQRQDARDAGYAAETRRLLSTAEALATSDPPVAYLLAVEAGRREGVDRIEAEGALQRVLTANPAYLGSFPVTGQYTFDRTGAVFVARTASGLLAYDVASRRQVGRRDLRLRRGVSGSQIAVTGDNVIVEGDGSERLRFWTPLLHRQGDALVAPAPVNALAANADVLVTGHSGGLVVVWDAHTHRERLRLQAPNDVYWVDVNADGNTVAALVNPTGEVVTWRVNTGERIGPTLSAAQSLNISLSPDGSHLAAIPIGQPVVFDVGSGAGTQVNGLTFATYVRFVDDDRVAITTESEVGLVDWRSSAVRVRVATPCSCDFAISPDGRTVATGQSYPSLFALDGRELLAESLPVAGAFTPYTSFVGASADGRFLSASTAFGLRVWKRTGSSTETLLDRLGAGGGVDTRGRLDSFDSLTQQFTEVDAATGRQLGSVHVDGSPLTAALSEDGRRLAVLTNDSTVTVYDTRNDRLITRLDDLAVAGAGNDFGFLLSWSMSFSPDGRWLAAGNWTGAALVWDTESWHVARRLALSQVDVNSSSSPVFDPTGNYVAAFTKRGTIDLFHASDLTPAGTIPLREQGSVYHMSFSPDGSLLAAVIERRVLVFDVASRRRIGGSFPITLANNVSIFGREPTMVAGDGQRMLLWNLHSRGWADVACTAAGRNLTAREWVALGPRDTDYRATCSKFPAAPRLPGLTAGAASRRGAVHRSPGATGAREDEAVARALARAVLPPRFPRALQPVGTGSALCPGFDPATDPGARSVTVRGSTAHLYSGPTATVSVLGASPGDAASLASGVVAAVDASCVASAGMVAHVTEYHGSLAGVVVRRWIDLSSITFVTVVIAPVGDRVVVVRWASQYSPGPPAEVNALVDAVASSLSA